MAKDIEHNTELSFGLKRADSEVAIAVGESYIRSLSRRHHKIPYKTKGNTPECTHPAYRRKGKTTLFNLITGVYRAAARPVAPRKPASRPRSGPTSFHLTREGPRRA